LVRKAISKFIGRRRIIDSGKLDRNSKSSSRRALASQWHPSEPRMDANEREYVIGTHHMRTSHTTDTD